MKNSHRIQNENTNTDRTHIENCRARSDIIKKNDYVTLIHFHQNLKI